MTKQQLRQHYLSIRKSIQDRHFKSVQIQNKLLELSQVKLAKNILIFQSLGTEVSTQDLIMELLDLQKSVFSPLLINGQFYFVQITRDWAGAALLKDDYGAKYLPASQFAEFRSEQLPQVAIIPGVAFSESGNRLGYGGGYIDRLFSLSPLRNAYCIGIAFSEQIDRENLDRLTEPHDVRMDLIVTEVSL